MNAKRKRELARMIGRRPGFFAPRICCDRNSSFCTGSGTFSISGVDDFDVYLITSSGFWSYYGEDLTVITVPSDSGVTLSAGTWCFWISDEDGEQVPGTIHAIIVGQSTSVVIDSSRIEGMVEQLEIGPLSNAVSFPVISPSSTTYVSLISFPLIVNIDLSGYTVGNEISVNDAEIATSVVFPPQTQLLNVTDLSIIENLDMSYLYKLDSVAISICPLLTSVDLQTNGPLVNVNINNCPLVEDFIIQNNGTPIAVIGIVDAALSETSVNNLMIYLLSVNFVGTLIINGGTSAAPTGAGASAMDAMLLNGASITVNP